MKSASSALRKCLSAASHPARLGEANQEVTMRIAFAVVLGLAVAIAIACGSSSTPAGNRFGATLDGPTETPPTTSTGTATASFIDDGQGTMTYTLTVQGLSSNWTVAHIHLGDAGIPGGVIVDLATGANGSPAAPTNATSGTVTGTITKPNTTPAIIKNPGPPLGDGGTMTYNDLLNYMRNGNTYVNVHTTKNQSGELRGQISAQ
jgi:CHRD domain